MPLDSDSPGLHRHLPHRTPPPHPPATAPHGYPAHSARRTRSRPASAPWQTGPLPSHSKDPRATPTAMQSSPGDSPHLDPELPPAIQRGSPSSPPAPRTDPTHTSHRPDSTH